MAAGGTLNDTGESSTSVFITALASSDWLGLIRCERYMQTVDAERAFVGTITADEGVSVLLCPDCATDPKTPHWLEVGVPRR